jgi:hypothetical protein
MYHSCGRPDILTIIFSKIMVKKIIGKINSDDLWESVAKNYLYMEGAQMSQL